MLITVIVVNGEQDEQEDIVPQVSNVVHVMLVLIYYAN